MSRRFAELAFTPLVKEQQEKHGSRYLYERAERSYERGDRLGLYEQQFIKERDGFYMASISETGWPYIQHRGGSKGFLRVLNDHSLGFADLRGNKQYISIGNLQHDNRVALFFMDYARQQRLKILGRAEVHEGDETAQELMPALTVPKRRLRPSAPSSSTSKASTGTARSTSLRATPSKSWKRPSRLCAVASNFLKRKMRDSSIALPGEFYCEFRFFSISIAFRSFGLSSSAFL
jgi:uncharacterized protein